MGVGPVPTAGRIPLDSDGGVVVGGAGIATVGFAVSAGILRSVETHRPVRAA